MISICYILFSIIEIIVEPIFTMPLIPTLRCCDLLCQMPFKSMNIQMIVYFLSDKDVIFSFNLIKEKIVDLLCLRPY